MLKRLSDLSISDANYLHDYVIEITFNNGVQKQVDLSSFFETNKADYIQKYKSSKLFKSFMIEEGNIVWGKNWDIIFPVANLYAGKI